ncbi:MAG: hypothetical protein ACRCZR_00445 [Cetobacterium sp.]
MRDKLIGIKNIWRFNGQVYVMIFDQYNRLRTFVFVYGDFREVNNYHISNYVLKLNEEDKNTLEKAIIKRLYENETIKRKSNWNF